MFFSRLSLQAALVASALLFGSVLSQENTTADSTTNGDDTGSSGGSSAADGIPILSVRGSGTTNPSKCYWHILNQMEVRAGRPIRMTYRAVGSSTGQAEFMNDLEINKPEVVDFASGDIPMPTEQYNELKAAGLEMIHLPIMLGSVSFFHSVPFVGQGSSSESLFLTPCVLARIFTGDITEWSHEDITELNPSLKNNPAIENLPINVIVRLRGSSSTSASTEYLRASCPDSFPMDLKSSLPEWPSDFKRCQGSSGVSACIKEKIGSIGYIDSGHGVAAGLEEVELQNLAGTRLNSVTAAENGGIADAEKGAFPDEPDADFGDVTLVNRDGTFVWPLVQMTYIYVLKNTSHIGAHSDPAEATLLVAFLKALQDEEYVGQCRDDYGFTLPSTEVLTLTKKGIDMLESNIKSWAPNSPDWEFEIDTDPIGGAGEFVISSKRNDMAQVQRDDLMKDVADLETQIVALKAQMLEMEDMVAKVSDVATADAGASDGDDAGATVQQNTRNSAKVQNADLGKYAFTEQNQTQLTAALVLGALSFCFWVVYIAVWGLGWLNKSG